MKKIITLAFSSLIIIFLINVSSSLALGLKDAFLPNSGIETIASQSGYTTDKPETLSLEYYIGLAINLLFSLIGIILIGLIVYSGIIWMTARGNQARVQKAKDTLIEEILGLLFVLGGYSLSVFLLKVFSK